MLPKLPTRRKRRVNDRMGEMHRNHCFYGDEKCRYSVRARTEFEKRRLRLLTVSRTPLNRRYVVCSLICFDVISGLGEFRAIFASWSDKIFGDEQLLIPVKLTTESGNVTSQSSAVDQNY